MSRPNLSEKVSRIEERVDRLEKAISGEQAPARESKRLLTTEEAAVFLGMTVDGLRGLTHKKLISYYKPNGKNMYFEVDELVAWQKRRHFEAIPAVLDDTGE